MGLYRASIVAPRLACFVAFAPVLQWGLRSCDVLCRFDQGPGVGPACHDRLAALECQSGAYETLSGWRAWLEEEGTSHSAGLIGPDQRNR